MIAKSFPRSSGLRTLQTQTSFRRACCSGTKCCLHRGHGCVEAAAWHPLFSTTHALSHDVLEIHHRSFLTGDSRSQWSS